MYSPHPALIGLLRILSAATVHQVIDASQSLMIYAGKRPVGRLLERLFTNDETIKTGSHISSQRLYFFEKLRLSGGDGWGFKVTLVFYDCHWMEHIFNKCPRLPACVVDPPFHFFLSLCLCTRWMCVCVAYDRVMCPGILVGFISWN